MAQKELVYQVAPNRIFIEDGAKLLAELDFPMVRNRKDVVDFNHTFVDSSLRGQGIAGKLYEKAILVLKENNWKARATCSYGIRWFSEHPEYKSFYE